MLNTREYEWADVTVIAGGRDLLSIRGVKISRKIEREAIYAKGRNPHSIQSGNKLYSGSLWIMKSDLDAMDEAAGGDALDLSFDILAAFGNPSAGDAIKVKRASGARITDIDEELKQGDKFMEIELPFVCLNVKNEV
jgi:hypothetical protein